MPEYIRDMARGDIERIAELEKICFRSPWSENSLRVELKNKIAHYRVIESDGQVIAYAGMWVLFEEAHITNVAVEPKSRGKGLGRAIMLDMMKTAVSHKACSMTLEVRESNILAQTLYFSLGFKNAGRRKKYYSDTGEDAFILWNDDIGATLKAQSARN